MNTSIGHLGATFYWIRTGPTSLLTFLDINSVGNIPRAQCVAPDDLGKVLGGDAYVNWDMSCLIGTTFVEHWEVHVRRTKRAPKQ